jgi:MoaA/NifB/PqqE/SkfB family radical SAM enzyme
MKELKDWKDLIQVHGLDMLMAYWDSDYKNLPQVVNWLEKLDVTGEYAGAFRQVKKVMTDPENNWNILIKEVYDDLDLPARKKLIKNFLVTAFILGKKKRKRVQQTENCNTPLAILLDPTSACNLNCKGCWAAEYGKNLSLSLETLDRIINEGKELGIYLYIYSGGEPLLREKDILTLCEKHADCVFSAFTNGTLIDETFADGMKRVGNFFPAISVEGFEEATDARRGKGTYRAAMRAMRILRERKLIFGASSCYTARNVAEVGSEAFIDEMIAQGAKFCWLFMYMPVGTDAQPDLLVSAADREFMYRQVRRFRREKPLLLMDFWNDGEYSDGCIAGGKRYLHINANGDVEPCAFVHYANCNIKDVS